MAVKRKAEGGRGRGVNADLINFDPKNEAQPLKQDVAVRKNGGLFLAPNGVKVEIIPGASTGRRERLLCAAVPSSVRSMLGPWLGPNLRMASDMQMFYSPQIFRSPVAVFIPFSCAAAKELTHLNELDDPAAAVYDTKKFKLDSISKDNNEGDSVPINEVYQGRRTKHSVKNKQPTLQLGKSTGKGPDLLDTRSVFLLCCRLGEERWDIVDKFTVIQPTVHHTNWPNDLKRHAAQSTRWHDSGVFSTATSESNYASKTRITGMNSRTRRTATAPIKEMDTVEQIRKIENYCGGIFIATEELHHLYVIVIGSRAENFPINRDGAFIRSSLLHPFLSVRIPKRSCLLTQTANFKAIEIRPTWSQTAAQFDPQMSEIEGCSDIYEFDLHDVILRRPAIVRIPLPQWFIERRSRSHENWEQSSTTVNSSEPQDPSGASHVGIPDGTYLYERPLILLFQPPGSRRQIVWQSANVDDGREDIGRRKSRFPTPRKDTAGSNRCKLENLYCRLGWSYLTVGLRGSQWYTMKQPLYFTKRTAFFETNMLGRFILAAARDPERTPSTKLAHLMSRVEALSVAPPGALVIFLQLQPNCWKIMVRLIPEDRLSDTIQEQVSAGFIPLVQMATGPYRRSIGLCNSIIQATDIMQMFKESPDVQKIRPSPPIRVNGADINHVLMYNGLCLEFRLTGDVRQKPVNQFEPLGQVLKSVKQPQTETDPESTKEATTASKMAFSLGQLGVENLIKESEPKRNLLNMLTSNAYFQQNELLSENSCVFEIEPILPDEENNTETNKFMQKSFEKLQLVNEGLRATIKRQEHDSDEYEDEDDENDEMLDSEEEGHRRSYSSGEQPSNAYDGNDGEVDEFTQEAQDKVVAGQPLSATTINSELLKRLNNVVEKSRFNRAGEFLQKVHDMFHIGKIEVWLVAPESLPQLAPPPSEKKDENTVPSEVYSDQQSQIATAEPAAVSSTQEVPDENLDDEDEDTAESVQEAHNATKWKPNAQSQQTDLFTNPTKPLAVYNLLIDPDLALGYNRSPTGKTGSMPVVQKKGARQKKSKGRQNNASTSRKGQKSRSPSEASQRNGARSPSTEVMSEDMMLQEYPQRNPDVLERIATHVRDPKELALRLGLTDTELQRITQNDGGKSVSDRALNVLRTWERYHVEKPHAYNGGTRGDMMPETKTARTKYGDLTKALQLIGCHEGIEVIRTIQ